jgi:hypothetical protein
MLIQRCAPYAAAEFEAFLMVIAQEPPLVVVERAEHRLCLLETAQSLYHSCQAMAKVQNFVVIAA